MNDSQDSACPSGNRPVRLRPTGLPATQLLALTCAEVTGRDNVTYFPQAARSLTRQGLVTEPSPGLLHLTDAGRAASQALLTTPGGKDIRAAQLSKLLEYHLVQCGGRTLERTPPGHLAPPDPLQLLLRGRFEPSPLSRVQRVPPCGPCRHRNAADLYRAQPEQLTLVTGYGLNHRGDWQHHSWLIRTDGRLLESGDLRTAYFGMELSEAALPGSAQLFVGTHGSPR